MQKKYLVAYNGSEAAKVALELAKHQAELRGSHVDVVTSMEGGPKEKPEVISDANFALEEAGQYLKKAGIDCAVHQLVRGLSPGPNSGLTCRPLRIQCEPDRRRTLRKRGVCPSHAAMVMKSGL